VDFLNKENKKLLLVDILNGCKNGNMDESQLDMMKNELNDIAFEN